MLRRRNKVKSEEEWGKSIKEYESERLLKSALKIACINSMQNRKKFMNKKKKCR